jgi:hypothetical protein
MIIVLAIGIAAFMEAAERPAGAITVELAKKCRAMALKAHPYKMPGEGPGSAAAERDYFNDCVARGGNMPEIKPTAVESGNSQSAAPPPAKQPAKQ